MAAPLEEVIAFVRTSSIDGERQLDEAIVFAELMLRELQATVDEWERTAQVLRDERDVRLLLRQQLPLARVKENDDSDGRPNSNANCR